MGYDLVGRRPAAQKNSENNVFVISSDQGTFQNSEGYLSSTNAPTDTLRFGVNNATWRFLWGYVQLASQQVGGDNACLLTQDDFEQGYGYHGHFLSREKSISIAKCCHQGRDMGLYDQYVQQELGQDPKDWYDFLDRFMTFCSDCDGFSIH